MTTLFDHLLAAYSADELRRFVAYLPGGHSLTPHLPNTNASLASLAEEVLRLLDRKERVDAALEAALIASRPNRAADIRAIFAALQRDPEALGVGPAPANTRINVNIGTVSGGQGVDIGHGTDAAIDLNIQHVEGGKGVVFRGPKKR